LAEKRDDGGDPLDNQRIGCAEGDARSWTRGPIFGSQDMVWRASVSVMLIGH
jgi:hypothetical protein